jgi:hypothetical protein
MTPVFTTECYPGSVAADDYNEVLRRQVEYFSSDQHLRDRAEPWRGLSPEECLVATEESCKEVEVLFAMMEPEVRERAMRPEPIPPEILAILEAMQR